MDEAVELIAERIAKGPSKPKGRRAAKKAQGGAKSEESQAQGLEGQEAEGRRDQRGCGVGSGPLAIVPRKPKEARRETGLPSKQQILDYLRTASAKSGKREIARAFGIKGGDRIALKTLLAEMAEEGLLAGNRKSFKERGQLPPVAVLEIVARDKDGELIAEPAVWDAAEGPRPRALVLAPRSGRGPAEPALGQGDRILARLTRLQDADVFGYRYEAEPIKRLPREQRRLIGIFRAKAARRRAHRSRRSQGAEGVADRARRGRRRQGPAISCVSSSAAPTVTA